MKIEIIGDPGTGNTYQEIHIDKVENYNPSATTVVNYYYGQRPSRPDRQESTAVPSDSDRAALRKLILGYADRLRPFVSGEWQGRYTALWKQILDQPEVSSSVYAPGKQRAPFNRNLVAALVHHLGSRGVIDNSNAAVLAEALEGDKEHPVRKALGFPPERSLQKIIDEIIAQVQPRFEYP